MLRDIVFTLMGYECLDLFFSCSWFTDFFRLMGYECLDLFFSGSRFTDINAYMYFFQGMETCVLRFILSNLVMGNYLSSFIPPFLFCLYLRFTDMNA